MDKNTIIGLVIISILLIGYMFLSRPSKEEIAERQRVQDSIAHEQLVKEEEARVAAELLKEEAEKAEKEAAAMADTLSPEQIDSIRNIKLRNEHGIFAKSVVGENKFTVVENNKMIITFLNKGGKIYSVQLKDYVTFNKEPLVLFNVKTDENYSYKYVYDYAPVVERQFLLAGYRLAALLNRIFG